MAQSLQESQKLLEASLSERFARFERELSTAMASSSKDISLAKLNDEFLVFKRTSLAMLDILQKQVQQLTLVVDDLEMQQRRNALLFLGMEEGSDSDLSTVYKLISNKLMLSDFDLTSIKSCYRLGAPSGRPRPILIRFSNQEVKNNVWRSKSKLKGSGVTLAEFLTKAKQILFVDARKHFGVNKCWTQDGVIYVKLPNSELRKIISSSQLETLRVEFPNITANVPAAASSSDRQTRSTVAQTKPQDNKPQFHNRKTQAQKK